jgi:hypothetical protein
MTDEEKVCELLLEWQRHQDRGEDVSPSVLCGERSDLVPLLTERISVLRWMGPTPDEPDTPEPKAEPPPLEPERRPAVSTRSMTYIVCASVWLGGAAVMVASREKLILPQFIGVGFVVCWVVTILAKIVADAGTPPNK